MRLANHTLQDVPTLAAVTPIRVNNEEANDIQFLFLINIGNASFLAPLSQLSDCASSIVDWLMAWFYPIQITLFLAPSLFRVS